LRSSSVKILNFDPLAPEELEPGKFADMAAVTAAVYSGEFSRSFLPNQLYVHYFSNIHGAVGMAFGFEKDFEVDTSRWKSARAYKRNVEFFSGCKTFHHVGELSDAVFDADGFKRSWTEFREVAQKINTNYNLNWLKTEMNSAFSVAQAAENWHQIHDEKDIFNSLTYQTAGDAAVRPEHAAWDGITRPVDDPFWDEHYPPNDFGCRCIVIQVRSERKTDLRGAPKNTSKVFANNAGKSGVIFPKTGHPYFRVPEEYKTAKYTNFGLITPE